MGLFDFFKKDKADINEIVPKIAKIPGAVLIDVREPGEYAGDRIPGSVNIPLGTIPDSAKLPKEKDTPLYVYCRSGARSSSAARKLAAAGYTNVTNLGGIMSYRGKTEK